ncbi:MAG: (2Fe-2S)-binding protein [Porticoccaceae bacterium]
MSGRFVRLAETDRTPLTIFVDGYAIQGFEGDTLMATMLGGGNHLRLSEFGDGQRAGFCLMGACQDCWVWTEEGEHLRACSITVADGMRINTQQLEATWSRVE